MAEALKQPPSDLYERDFYAWTQDQAAKLRARAHNSVDWENAAEEIESLGRSERGEIRSRLLVTLVHLLKWRFQPAHRSASWKATLAEQRSRLADVLEESPSLRSFPETALEREYRTARLKASGETDLPEDVFPAECPFMIDEILDPDFYPDAA
ncbi:DUF29 domain-containing protein [Aureimonas mangrovi]|uniref:DUF29 domain-containing protein n=1 Tax=Aureimonas mangrovi TaxID=2758041 RepID=UPI00163DB4DE|nr:DUF29 domain-containing protein [Aureimonas mangrovi]